jgi:hypothetical protein
MPHPVQFLLGQDGQPQFAVLPYQEYIRFKESLPEANLVLHSASLLSADKTRILLPNGGPGAYIDLIQLVHYFNKFGIIDMAINMRAQTLEKFPNDQKNTLDPLIRCRFLPLDSPYKNTMQATTAVVDALVESGLFSRIKKLYPYFFRPVNAIAPCEAGFKQFIATHPSPSAIIEIPAL